MTRGRAGRWGYAVAAFVFDSFEIDLERFVLLRNGSPVSIGPRAFDVLAYLIRNRDRPVSKQELVSNVWGVTALSYSAVPTCIAEVRRGLSDPRGSRGIIATVPKRGYRFSVPVRLVEEAATAGLLADGETGAPGTPTIFVGRDRELGVLGAALAESRNREPRLVFVAGEAGIGKTRIAEEFLLRARREGCVTVIARCHECDGAPAFWPWVQIARACAERFAPDQLTDAFGPFLPYLAPLLDATIAVPDGAPLPLDEQAPQATRFRLFDAMARLLRRVSADRHVVLTIDDLHRADPASFELLQFVIRELADSKILIIATYRDAEFPNESGRAQILASLIREPHSRSISLAGFSLDDVSLYLAKSGSANSTDEDLAEALHERSGGNPFFLAQLLQLLTPEEPAAARGKTTDPGNALPRGLREAISRQIADLPLATQQLLAGAAINGREFSLTELALALTLPTEELLAAVAPALQARLVRDTAGRPYSYRFNHVLLRDALYESIDLVERSRLHRLIGEAIETVSANHLDSRAPELAHHFVQAARSGSSESAVRYSIRAARRAAAQLAFEDACDHYRVAIGLIEPHGNDDLLHQCDLLLALGEVEIRAGERAASHATLGRAAELAREIPSPERLARAALGLAPGLFAIEAGVVDPVLIARLEEALAALPPGDSPLRSQLLARLAIALVWSDAEQRRDALSREAIDVARRVDDPATRGLALIARHGTTWPPQRLTERKALLRELGRCSSDAQSEELSLVHHVLEIALHFELGNVAAANREIDSFTRSARYRRDQHALWYAGLFACVRASLEGRGRDVEQHSRAFLEQGLRVGDVNAMEAYGAQLVARSWDEGRPEDVIEKLQEMVRSYPTLFAWKGALGISYLEAGQLNDARRTFEELALHDFRNMPWNEAGAINYCFLADLAYEFGDRHRARLLYEILLPAASHFVVGGFASVFRGSIARSLGLLAGTLGHYDVSTDHFEHALQQNARAGAVPFVAQTQYDYARTLLRRANSNDREKAKLLVGEGLKTAARLDLHRLGEKLRVLPLD